MTRLARLLLVAAVAAGCVRYERIARVRDVRDLPPGYAVMLATFEYVPGQSTFDRSQVVEDAYYIAGRLSVVGYQSFVADDGENRIRVGARASTHAMARALQREIERTGTIDLGDGNKLSVPEPAIINLAELKMPPVR